MWEQPERVDKVQSNQKGDLMSVLKNALKEVRSKIKDLSEVEFEAHPLLEQVCVQQQLIATHTHARDPPFLSLTPLLSSLLLSCRSRRLPTTQKASL